MEPFGWFGACICRLIQQVIKKGCLFFHPTDTDLKESEPLSVERHVYKTLQ